MSSEKVCCRLYALSPEEQVARIIHVVLDQPPNQESYEAHLNLIKTGDWKILVDGSAIAHPDPHPDPPAESDDVQSCWVTVDTRWWPAPTESRGTVWWAVTAASRH